jgi:signal transduction histidine kinase
MRARADIEVVEPAARAEPAMGRRPVAIFRRIYIIVFLLIAMLGLLFMGVTYLATTSFYTASTQLLNKDVAAHIAKFTSPYGREGFDRQKADSVFYQAMVISPSAEVYFLDTTGRVIYFHGDTSEIREWRVSTVALQRYIQSGGLQHIDGPDPRDPDHSKIFSAAVVEGERGKLGYIYVILGNEQYRSVTQMLMNSRVTPMVLGAVMFILALSLLITVLYINRWRRRFEEMMGVLGRFRRGDFSARFALRENDELELVTGSFNNMADLLLDNINRVTASENERRDFMVNISHDLRTPLAIARGYTETLVLKKGQLRPEEEADYIELVMTKIRQVEKMVGQLFELSKMESANFEMRREPFVFSEVLQEVVQATGGERTREGAADIRSGSAVVGQDRRVERGDAGSGVSGGIECRNCTDGSYVNADISMMERVLQNLVVNAVAYTRPGGKIRVGLDREGGELVFRIENEGVPLEEELFVWINGVGDKPARSAIGLAIVRKILALHGFGLRVEVRANAQAAGSDAVNIFSFRMPIYER